jgi:hypothetical protein
MTFSIMTLNIPVLSFIIRYAECRHYLNVRPSVVILNVDMLNVVMMNVIMLNVVMISVVII